MQVGILFYTHKTDFKKRENIGTEFKRVINGALTRITNFIFVIHFTQSTLEYEKLIVNLTKKKQQQYGNSGFAFLKKSFYYTKYTTSRKLNYDKCITSL